MEEESYIGKNRGKQKHLYKEDREDLRRGINDMRELLQQAVWLLAVIGIMILAVIIGGVALILMLS